jgi:hypothetical protein
MSDRMLNTTQTTADTAPQTNEDEFGPAPGDEENDIYIPTDNVKGGGRGGTGLLWFCCVNASEDLILPLADCRSIEPGALTDPHAVMHFSGLDVVLEGELARQVAHRIFLGRCTIIREIRPGQKVKNPDTPIIRSIRFLVPPKAKADDTPKKKPRHESETERAKP